MLVMPVFQMPKLETHKLMPGHQSDSGWALYALYHKACWGMLGNNISMLHSDNAHTGVTGTIQERCVVVKMPS